MPGAQIANQIAGSARDLEHEEPCAEEVWIREFVGFYGTDNLTRVVRSRLAVSLTRAVEAMTCGIVVRSTKLDRSGCVCVLRHHSDDDLVEIQVFFEANTMELEIRDARIIEESESEPNAA